MAIKLFLWPALSYTVIVYSPFCASGIESPYLFSPTKPLGAISVVSPLKVIPNLLSTLTPDNSSVTATVRLASSLVQISANFVPEPNIGAVLSTFTSISSERPHWPTTIPPYTCSPAPIKLEGSTNQRITSTSFKVFSATFTMYSPSLFFAL